MFIQKKNKVYKKEKVAMGCCSFTIGTLGGGLCTYVR